MSNPAGAGSRSGKSALCIIICAVGLEPICPKLHQKGSLPTGVAPGIFYFNYFGWPGPPVWEKPKKKLEAKIDFLKNELKKYPKMDGLELSSKVSTKKKYFYVVFDFCSCINLSLKSYF